MSFQFPSHYSLPPFFTLQPVLETRNKQIDLWTDLIVKYCEAKRIFYLDPDNNHDLFNNKKIQRKLKNEDIKTIFDGMVKRGKGEWLNSKEKERCLIYWKTPEEWGDMLFNWAVDNGLTDTVCTLWELMHGENAEGTEFYEMNEHVLRKALKHLEKQQKAQVFAGSSAENQGVKFFS
eukprot:gb/GECH01008574.1/.p1 GENE.gb/GECH01008574.1/~~gb/GECH01008574.1/.p1  ORF type:complete len:177 (+),score=54.81 gb/GECH01008574.1/:1-531(+)